MNKIKKELKKEIHNYTFSGLNSYAFWSTEKLADGNIQNIYIPICDPDLWNRNSIMLQSYRIHILL
jgi:hypothetical protein